MVIKMMLLLPLKKLNLKFKKVFQKVLCIKTQQQGKSQELQKQLKI